MKIAKEMPQTYVLMRTIKSQNPKIETKLKEYFLKFGKVNEIQLSNPT